MHSGVVYHIRASALTPQLIAVRHLGKDSETRPGEFVIFMLSITIEKEDVEVNCLYKTRWDSYPGIG
jgi:hypothetical protein